MAAKVEKIATPDKEQFKKGLIAYFEALYPLSFEPFREATISAIDAPQDKQIDLLNKIVSDNFEIGSKFMDIMNKRAYAAAPMGGYYPPLGNTAPLFIGLLVVGIGLGWGANAGYAINPARDFAPRIASWLTGYHDAMYSTNGPELYFWLPIVAPLVGGLIGGALFVFGIERFLPAAITEPAEIGVVEPTPLR